MTAGFFQTNCEELRPFDTFAEAFIGKIDLRLDGKRTLGFSTLMLKTFRHNILQEPLPNQPVVAEKMAELFQMASTNEVLARAIVNVLVADLSTGEESAPVFMKSLVPAITQSHQPSSLNGDGLRSLHAFHGTRIGTMADTTPRTSIAHRIVKQYLTLATALGK